MKAASAITAIPYAYAEAQTPKRAVLLQRFAATRTGPDWFWKLAGMLGFRGPIVDREKMYGDDPGNDPYQHDFDPNGPDRR